MITEVDLPGDDRFDLAREIDTARDELETYGRVTPRFLFVYQPDGRLALDYILAPAYAATPPGRERDFMGDLLRLRAEEIGAIAYCSIMEVWILRGTKDRPPDRRGLTDWSTHPDRIEAVTVMLETEAGVASANMPIIRKPGRPPTFASGATWTKLESASGRLVGVLPVNRNRGEE